MIHSCVTLKGFECISSLPPKRFLAAPEDSEARSALAKTILVCTRDWFPRSPMKEDAAQPVLPANDAANVAFSQTHWTNVLRAKGSSSEAGEALNHLCRRYWPPVYAFIRRKWTQHSPQKAEDLTQEFFVEFIRKFPH